MFGILDSMDFTLAYMSVNVLLFLYGVHIARYLIRQFEGKNPQKFIFFSILIIILGQMVIPLTKLIPIWDNTSNLRGLVILGLIFWSYREFDRVVVHSLEPSLV